MRPSCVECRRALGELGGVGLAGSVVAGIAKHARDFAPRPAAMDAAHEQGFNVGRGRRERIGHASLGLGAQVGAGPAAAPCGVHQRRDAPQLAGPEACPV